MSWRAIVVATTMLALAGSAQADVRTKGGWTSGRPDGHAPIGVVGDHTHRVHEWMVSYSFGYMWMEGNRTGTSDTSIDDVLAAYMVAPKNMWMIMNTLGGMYAPSDRVTLMFMLPYIAKEMEHVTRTGVEFTTSTAGLSDLKLTALVGLADGSGQRLHLNTGISAPIGKVEERGDTPSGSDLKLPYPMQLGSGTWDVTAGLTYLGQWNRWSWGVQGLGVFRLGENSEGYTLGDVYKASAWGARRLGENVSLPARVAGSRWGNIDGTDSDLNPTMVPTADPKLRFGTRVDAALGANYYATGGYFKGHRLAVELLLPFYQDLEGPQLQRVWAIVAGWQLAWSPW